MEYCNGDESTPYGALRANRGHKEPYNVQFWSLGNEFGYGHMEGANTSYDYSKAVITHANKMLEVSPGLTLCSSGPYPNSVKLSPTGQVLSLMKYHANGMICALQKDVTATRKGNILTCTLLNRSYDQEKRFILPDIGELIDSVLYSSDSVVPNSIFTLSVLPVEKKEGTLEFILP